jgi:8-oxo-dGTP pyrophosphatase MutT (NUDIX family)
VPGSPRSRRRSRVQRPSRASLSEAAETLARRLITPAEAEKLDVHGDTEAAVLVPLYDWPADPGLILTERHGELRRHAGEISFPGGRRDDSDESLAGAALREAEEEIALRPTDVELVGALPPVGTFVTGYKVFPFVGLIPADVALTASPIEVAAVLRLRISDLERGYAKRRLVRRGVPIKTDTYLVGEHLIWGATARILAELLERLV